MPSRRAAVRLTPMDRGLSTGFPHEPVGKVALQFEIRPVTIGDNLELGDLVFKLDNLLCSGRR